MGKINKPIGHAYDYIFRENFYFYFGWTPEEMRTIWSHFEVCETTKGRCFETRQGIHMWFRDKYNWGVIVHECIHAGNFFLKNKGVKLTRNNDETLVYFVQWLFEHAMEATYEDSKRKSKRKTLRTKSKRHDDKGNNQHRSRRR